MSFVVAGFFSSGVSRWGMTSSDKLGQNVAAGVVLHRPHLKVSTFEE